ncbi:PAAR-like domain-containing protein [Pseudomonas sp. 1152_12]|uniref:PAAR-like domain-containing protein n=1 Tax=Pseudomonas sp. 1152_12 TaxID=2604455 RepID=UPI004063E090
MANQVFANNMEVSCKAADGKSIACFPDVCFTPPVAPPTPLGVPIPYPNTGLAKDTTKGTRTVKISGKEVMLKDQSYFKTSYGDEPGNAPKKGIVTSKIKGKVYFTSWSMDVKYEGKNVVRHMDLTTHNHASQPGNTVPWAYMDRMALANESGQCESEKKQAQTACKDTPQNKFCPDISPLQAATKARKAAKTAAGDGFKSDPAYLRQHAAVQSEYGTLAKTLNDDACQRAMRCFLAPYRPNKCCPGQTGDHLIDSASFTEGPAFTGQPRHQHRKKAGWSKYKTNKAPVMCAEGPNQTTATHGQMHTRRGVVALKEADANGEWPRAKATETGAKAAKKTFPDSDCSQQCLEAQLNTYHDKAKDPGKERPIKACASMTSNQSERDKAWAEMRPRSRRR